MRSHFLHSVLGLTALGAALVACGDDSADGAGGGGGATSGTEAAGPTTGPGQGSTSAITGTGVVAASSSAGSPVAQASSSSGGAECEGLSPEMGGLFTDPAVNECAQANCCAELIACDFIVDPTACFTPEGAFDLEKADAVALDTCVYEAGCYGAVVCDSGIGFTGDDPETLEYAGCLSVNCCDEMNDCTSDGGDVDACLECLTGEADDFSLCQAVHECAIANCEDGLVFVPICTSGLGTGNIPSGECANENCCDPYVECTGGTNADGEPNDQEQLEACLDCLTEGSGDLCDAAIACELENCNASICDSGLQVPGDLELAACLSDNCCKEYTGCTGGDPKDEDAVTACLDCIIEALETGDEPGALCASAVQCELDNCSGGEGGGGAGGAPGTGGGGGAGGN